MSKENKKVTRKIKDIQHKIISNCYSVLEGRSDPFEIDLIQMINEVSDFRRHIKNEKDINDGIHALSVITRVRLLKDEFLENKKKGIYDKNIWNIIHNYFNRDSQFLKNLGKELLKERFISSMFSPINVISENADIIRGIEQIYPKIIFNTKIDVSNEIQTSIPKIDIKEINFESYINKIMNELDNTERVPLLKFILTNDYQETQLRLECICHLLSSGKIKLSFANDDEKHEAGRYVIGTNNDQKFEGYSIILGLDYDEWIALQKCIKLNNFSNRIKLNLID
ncbi:MAG: hypothetical protein ACTSPY_04120 [Candidatus Helarchaeota archaeon]